LVAPLKDRAVSPNHLTSLRLAVGLGAAACFVPGSYGWSNVGALLLVISNFLDHADGELARLSGKMSWFGHQYDLVSDAAVTILLFIAIGLGVEAERDVFRGMPPAVLGAIAGSAIALIFYLRMRIEAAAGKSATRQTSVGGFETEDVLYLMPLATLSDALQPLLIAAAICAPLYLAWVIFDHRRVMRERQPLTEPPTSGVGQ
jgi:phosphatidylglycerophosphate synthase